jgi:hypothetical protein
MLFQATPKLQSKVVLALFFWNEEFYPLSVDTVINPAFLQSRDISPGKNSAAADH